MKTSAAGVTLLLALTSIQAACTNTRVVNLRPEYKFELAPEGKLDERLALVVDSSARAHVLQHKWSSMGQSTVYKVAVGAALEKAATQAFQIAFREVRVVSGHQSADVGAHRVLQIRFGDSTAALFSNNKLATQKARVQLTAQLLDGDRRAVWETTVTETRDNRRAGTVAAGAVLGGVLGGGMVQSGYEGAMEKAVREALQASLETLVVRVEAHLKK